MDDLKLYLDLLARDGDVAERLIAFWPAVEPRLPAVVAHLQKLAQKLAFGADHGECDFERLKRVLSLHLTRVLSWRLDDDYVESVVAMHFAFRSAALGRPEITAIYNTLARSLTTCCVETCRWTPGTLASIQQALTAAILLDLSMVLSAHEYADKITPRTPAKARYARDGLSLSDSGRVMLNSLSRAD